jgi:hypothetical protein
MKIRRMAVLGAVLAAVAPVMTLTPVAADAATTTATFSITAGGLSITAPSGTVALTGATAATGASSVAGTLGSVSVADTRGNAVATWTTTFSSTTFTTGGATADETVALASISYASGTVTKTGTGAAVANAGTAMSAAANLRVVTFAGIGNNTATWNPTLTFTLLSSQVAGTYSGTVTHSVI